MILASRFHVIVFLVALLSLLGGGMGTFADDPGVGWHLESGQWMLQHGMVPAHDPFLVFPEARAWVSDQWLSDIILAALFNWGGFELSYAVLLSLFMLTFFVILTGALVRSGIPCLAASAASLAAFKIAQVHFLLRPVIFGIFCFALLFAALLPLYRHQVRGDKLRQYLQRMTVALPVLFLFWANLHPSFTLGLLLIALVDAGFFLCRICNQGENDPSELAATGQRLLLILFVSGLATLINPYHIELHRSIFALGSSTFFMNYHQEWLSPDFTKPEGQFFEIMLLGAFVAMIFRQKVAPISMIDVLLLVVFTHFSLDAVRFLPFFGMVIAPYFARSFGFFEAFRELPVFRLLLPAIESLEQRQRGRSPDALVLIGILLLVTGWTVITGRLPLYQGDYGPSRSAFPYEALEKLAAALPEPRHTVLAAEAGFGGFITWRGQGKIRALHDDRNTLLGEEFYRKYDRALERVEIDQDFFRALGAEYLMVRKDSRAARRLVKDSSLPLVAEDGVVDIFLLNQPG